MFLTLQNKLLVCLEYVGNLISIMNLVQYNLLFWVSVAMIDFKLLKHER